MQNQGIEKYLTIRPRHCKRSFLGVARDHGNLPFEQGAKISPRSQNDNAVLRPVDLHRYVDWMMVRKSRGAEQRQAKRRGIAVWYQPTQPGHSDRRRRPIAQLGIRLSSPLLRRSISSSTDAPAESARFRVFRPGFDRRMARSARHAASRLPSGDWKDCRVRRCIGAEI